MSRRARSQFVLIIFRIGNPTIETIMINLVIAHNDDTVTFGNEENVDIDGVFILSLIAVEGKFNATVGDVFESKIRLANNSGE